MASAEGGVTFLIGTSTEPSLGETALESCLGG